jgi:hypothetical protein
MSALDSLSLAAIPPEDEALRGPVREFLAQAMQGVPARVRARSWSGYDREFSRELGRRGWLGLTLPRDYGGAGRSPHARYVLVEEFLNWGAPVGSHWVADRQSAPLILKYGTEAQKRFYIPPICRGESFFCIGMSEPNAGSDLASVGSRAQKVDGGWRLDGRKIWTTNAHHCHYMIALVRTSGEPADRQRGLSQFIVDLSLPGVTVRPIRDLAGDAHFNEVFFDDVRLPDDALIGNEGSGWEQVNAELAFERSGPERIYSSVVLLEHWIEILRRSPDRGRHATAVGRFATHLAALRHMSIAVTAKLVRGESPIVEAALVKDIGTTFEQEIPAVLEGLVAEDPAADLDGDLFATVEYLAQVCPTFSLRGGTREILRGMIARGLGLR